MGQPKQRGSLWWG